MNGNLVKSTNHFQPSFVITREATKNDLKQEDNDVVTGKDSAYSHSRLPAFLSAYRSVYGLRAHKVYTAWMSVDESGEYGESSQAVAADGRASWDASMLSWRNLKLALSGFHDSP